jgi:hypothetical protein
MRNSSFSDDLEVSVPSIITLETTKKALVFLYTCSRIDTALDELHNDSAR